MKVRKLRNRKLLPTLIIFPFMLFARVYQKGPDLEMKGMIFKLPAIFFGFVSVPNSQRQVRTMNYWLHKLKYPNNYMFITKQSKDRKFNYLKPIFGTCDTIRFNKDEDRAIKRMAGMQYFFDHVEYDYYWSLTDDVFIDVDNLEMLQAYLLNKYNASKDKVFIGQNDGTFLQGGVGFVMSRAAAEIILPHGNDWTNNINTFDDIELDKFRVLLGLNQSETYSPFVFGEEPKILEQIDFQNNKYKKCDDKPLPWSRNYELPRLIALHTRNVNISLAMNNLIKAKNIVTNLYYRYKAVILDLCVGKEYNITDIKLGR